VGLPLAAAFGTSCATIGFDADVDKVAALRAGTDPAGQLDAAALTGASGLELTDDPRRLVEADFIVVAVPTPVDNAHRPDFAPLLGASRTVGRHMKRGCIVAFESTVYPGATEEVCVPALEEASGMTWRTDFNVAYSPERINPGDSEHTLQRIVKLVAGDDPDTLEKTARLYEQVIDAGVYRVSSIKVAEAAKVIENTQRDLNIALVNELAIIFRHLGIDTLEVLQAAGTKWNFLPFRPGLVGGHCIGVDPYYLTHKAQMLGYHPQVILAGRQINDGMAKFVAEQSVKHMIRAGLQVKGARVNVLGLTFKENCPDLRNSLVADLVEELTQFGLDVSVHDPLADPAEALHEYGIRLVSWDALPRADALLVAVPHRAYLERPLGELVSGLVEGGCFIDVKAVFDCADLESRGFKVWRL
jgi:UDP-N-acetyl-D-galactosamine dehydrogenase